MIVSYETLRTLSEYLANCTIGLLLCDEGHRLKNSGWLNFRTFLIFSESDNVNRVSDFSSPQCIECEAQSNIVRNANSGNKSLPLDIPTSLLTDPTE